MNKNKTNFHKTKNSHKRILEYVQRIVSTLLLYLCSLKLVQRNLTRATGVKCIQKCMPLLNPLPLPLRGKPTPLLIIWALRGGCASDRALSAGRT